MDFKYRFLAFVKKRYLYLLIFWAVFLYVLYAYVLKSTALFAANQYAGLLLILLVFLVSLSAYMLVTRKIFNDLWKILEERCDPDEYLRIYRFIIHKLRRKGKSLHFSYFLGYSEGLIAAGKYQDALDVLKTIKGFGKDKKGLRGAASYYNCLCAAYLGLGKADKAREAYKGIEKSFAAMKEGGGVSGYSFISKSYLLKMAQNNYKGAGKFFESMSGDAIAKRDRMNGMFYLGEVSLRIGDKARAKEAFENVISDGGKLHIAQEAKEKFSQLA